MKTKYLFFALICFGAICISLAEDTRPADKESICDLLRVKLCEAQEDCPIDVLFFDLNNDGIPDALVSLRMDTSPGGCHGDIWELYRFENGEWQISPHKAGDDYDPLDYVHARGDDFFSLTEEGQKPKLFLVYSSWGRNSLAEDTEVTQKGYEITIDNEGYLKAISVPELSTNYFPRYDEKNDAFWLESTEMEEKLVPVPVVTLDPPQKDEVKEALPVATAEADVQDGEQGETASPSQTKGGGTRDDEAVPQSNRNRLWLYAVIALALFAVFYFVRKKTGN